MAFSEDDIQRVLGEDRPTTNKPKRRRVRKEAAPPKPPAPPKRHVPPPTWNRPGGLDSNTLWFIFLVVGGVCAVIFGPLLLAGVVHYFTGYTPPTETERLINSLRESEELTHQIHIDNAKERVRQQLLSPSSAVFSNMRYYDELRSVSGTVESDNAFGVRVRQEFVVDDSKVLFY